MFRQLIIILFLSVQTLFANTGIEGYYSIPYVTTHGLMLMNSHYNGQDGVFIFDTGCDAVLINGVVSGSQKVFETIAGKVSVSPIEDVNLSFTDLSMFVAEGWMADLSHLEALVKQPLLGIIGMSDLAADVIHVNIKNQTIDLYPNHMIHQVANGNYAQMDMQIHNNLPWIQMSVQGKSYIFLLDTGSSISVFNKNNLANKRNKRNWKRQEITLTTVSESKSALVFLCDKISDDRLSVSNMPVIFEDLSAIDDTYAFGGILSIEQLPFDEIILDKANEKLFYKLMDK